VYLSETELEDNFEELEAQEEEREEEGKEERKQDKEEDDFVFAQEESLAIMTSKLKIADKKESTSVCCKGDIPVVVTTYDDKHGSNIAVADVICFSGTMDDQYNVEVSNDRLSVELKFAIPATFLHPRWLTLMDKKLDRHSARYQAFNRVMEALRKDIKLDQPYAVLKIPMPFKVEKSPHFTNIIAFDTEEEAKRNYKSLPLSSRPSTQ